MEKEGKISEVLLSSIHPDENQPRKDFNAARLAELMASIKEHGIMNPLVVEGHPSGQYLLIDGERRYRAAKELKLRKVPVIVLEPMNETDRLIKQFHLQEQHEGWSALEKAVAIGQLSESMKIPVSQLARMLSLPTRTVADYTGFWNLMSRREYQKSEMPIGLAKQIVRARERAKKIYEETFEKEFTEAKQKGIEQAIMAQIKAGEVTRITDITKLVDTFVNEPKTIDTFLKGKTTITKLYLDSHAKVAHHARNVGQLANILEFHMRKTMELGGVELVTNQGDGKGEATVRRLQKVLDEFVTKM